MFLSFWNLAEKKVNLSCLCNPSTLSCTSSLLFSVQLFMCATDKEEALSQSSGTRPSAPLISSVNAVEITAVEVKHVSQ